MPSRCLRSGRPSSASPEAYVKKAEAQQEEKRAKMQQLRSSIEV